MNLIIIEQHELNGDNVTLSDNRCTHIRKVLRCQQGDTVKIGLLNGLIGKGEIIHLSKERVSLKVNLHRQPLPKPKTDLILALPRPIMLKRVLSQAAQMGVGKIHLINANRVEKSFFSASILQEKSLNNFLKLGLEQAADTRLPELTIHRRFRPFIEDFLPENMTPKTTLGLVAHPTAAKTLVEAVKHPQDKQVMLAIGPEGGWVDFEIEKFQEQGFHPFTLGPRILRVDTAVPALLSQLQLLTTTNEP